VSGSDGSYRLRVPADAAAERCIYVTLDVSGVAAGVMQVAEARDRTPLVVIRADLTLP
jgi:hypothetical protein